MVKDVPFFTKSEVEGPLQDAWNFTDGLTHAQFPTVNYFTGLNGTGTDITALVVKDISGDTITSATHKDPTGSTGVWRKLTAPPLPGTYRNRVLPNASLALTTYYMRISFFPVDGIARVEDHEVEIISPGDIVFGDLVFSSITVADILAGITTVLDDANVEALAQEAADEIEGALNDCGIDTSAWEELPKSIRLAIILLTRWKIGLMDLSSTGTGGGIKKIEEGSEKITFASASPGTMTLEQSAFDKVRIYCRKNSPGRQPMIRTIVGEGDRGCC